MNRSRLFGAFGACLCLLASSAAFPSLLGRLPATPGGTDFQAYYDTDLDITWLANANLAASNNFGVTSGIILTGSAAGQMNWAASQNWLAGMNTASYLGYNDWRLPATLYPDTSCSGTGSFGQNCTGSELGHLFYLELGGTAGSSILASTDPDLAKFQNLHAANYWSTDITYTAPTTDAFVFQFASGGQLGIAKTSTEYVWAVRTGDVVVPLPAAAGLFGAGLLGLSGIARRKKVA